MADSIYRIVVKFQAEGQEQLASTIPLLEQLQQQGAKVGIQVGKGTQKASLGMNSLIRSGLRVGFMLNMVESAYMRQTMAMMMATNAQERYNTIVARYGRNSEEARKAAKQMEMQMEYLNLANNRANISTGLLVAQMALQTGIFEKERLATIKATAAKYGHALATKLENVSIKELLGVKALNTAATKIQTKILKTATAIKSGHILATQAETAANKSSVLSIIAHKIATAAASVVDAAHTAVLKAKAIALAMASGGTLVPVILAAGAITAAAVGAYVGSKQEGGIIRETGLYTLHKGETVIPANKITNSTVTSKQQTKNMTTNESRITNNERSVINTTIEGNKQYGGNISKTGLYMLHAGEYVVPKAQVNNASTIASSTAFNFETHLHLETDLDSALTEQNRRIINAYRSEVG